MADDATIAAAAARRSLSAQDWVVLACLMFAALLAWAWLLWPSPGGIDMAMPPRNVWSRAYLASGFTMWSLMMAAMMLPSAAPMVLLHARVARHGGAGGLPSATLVFALAYLALWTAFAALATLAQAALISTGSLTAMSLQLGDTRLAAALLTLAALYNLSAAKRACLDKCRSPLAFVMRGWRPGAGGALKMGLAHGLFCIGCCWLLMALLFVGGVMNLAWVFALAGIVVFEKYGPPWTGTAVAALLASGAVVLALV